MDDNNRDVKVSVIVPVYNVERYVRECLLSIINQTLKDIEIIIVNDGSTDSSYKICEEVARMDERVRLFSQENSGLGPARNFGMSLARGEYLSFVDSDDYIEEGFLECLYGHAAGCDADVAEAEIRIYHESSGKSAYHLFDRDERLVRIDGGSFEEFLREFYFASEYTPYACDKIFRRRFVQKNGVLFGDNKRIFSEDEWFQFQLLRYFPTVAFCRSPKYVYRQRAGSIMNAPKKDLLSRHMTAAKDYLEIIASDKRHQAEEKIADLMTEEIIVQVAINAAKFGGSREEFMRDMRRLQCDDQLSDRLAHISERKSYRLIKKFGRRHFVIVTSCLFRFGRYGAAFLMYWHMYCFIYRCVRRGQYIQ